MSTILKALRRLEEDGRAEEFVDLAERVVQAPAVRSPSMGLVALVAEVSAGMQWNITGPDASWAVDFKKGAGSVKEGRLDNADVTFTIADDDLLALVNGDETARALFQNGKLRVDGDVRVAQRLGFLKALK